MFFHLFFILYAPCGSKAEYLSLYRAKFEDLSFLLDFVLIVWFVRCMKIRKLKTEIMSIPHNSLTQ